MQQTTIDGVWMWSSFETGRGRTLNAYLVVRPEGNVMIDPLALESGDVDQVARLGGVDWVAFTDPRRERETRIVHERFHAKIAAAPPGFIAADRIVVDGETLCGGHVIALAGLTPGAFALHRRED